MGLKANTITELYCSNPILGRPGPIPGTPQFLLSPLAYKYLPPPTLRVCLSNTPASVAQACYISSLGGYVQGCLGYKLKARLGKWYVSQKKKWQFSAYLPSTQKSLLCSAFSTNESTTTTTMHAYTYSLSHRHNIRSNLIKKVTLAPMSLMSWMDCFSWNACIHL